MKVKADSRIILEAITALAEGQRENAAKLDALDMRLDALNLYVRLLSKDLAYRLNTIEARTHPKQLKIFAQMFLPKEKRQP